MERNKIQRDETRWSGLQQVADQGFGLCAAMAGCAYYGCYGQRFNLLWDELTEHYGAEPFRLQTLEEFWSPALAGAVCYLVGPAYTEEIYDILMKESLEASIYITVDTMKYLKKGGRVTPTAAALGTVLNIKPVLQIQGGKLDTYAKVRGWKAAKKSMLDAIEKDITERLF